MSTTTKSFTSKKGVTINAGERVTVSFNVKRRLTEHEIHAFNLSTNSHYCPPVNEFLPNYIRITTHDGRSVVTRNFKGAGIRVPSMKTLERWVCDSVCESVFGSQVEPDGWDSDGSPSWLLVFGLV
jgi:hypothetical protein